jgi:hypothetical protein
MRIFGRVETLEGVLAFLERVFKWGWPLIGAVLTGWAVKATSVFAQYAPASWVFAGILGGLAFLCAYWLWSAARLRMVRYNLARDHILKLPEINPLEDTFTRRVIDINTFKLPYAEPVKGKSFINCEIRGPAVIAFVGNATLQELAIMDCEFIEVRDDAKVMNVILFQDITVRGGKLYRLTVLVPSSKKLSIPANANWLT